MNYEQKVEGFIYLGTVGYDYSHPPSGGEWAGFGRIATSLWSCEACRLVTDDPVFHPSICPRAVSVPETP